MTKKPNILSVRVGGASGTVYHNVRLHGSGGLCRDRDAAVKLLELRQIHGEKIMLHHNYSAQGSDQTHHFAVDVEILPTKPEIGR